MSTLLINPSEGIQELESAGFSRAQVAGLGKYITGLLGQISEARHDTREYLASVQAGIAAETAERKVGIAEQRAAMATHKAQTQDEIKNLRLDMQAMHMSLKDEIMNMRMELKSDIMSVREDVQRSYRMLLMWMVATQIGALALMVAVFLGVR